MKKFLALLLALVMTMSLVTVGASAKTAFTDDKDITEVEAVEVLSAMGIIDGYKDGSFKPQGALNRAAGAKFIAYLMLGEKNADGLKATGTVFEDVAADYALAPYVEWCAKMGIVDGYGDGKFGPTNTLTQAAFGKMLLTALGYDSAKEGYTGAGWQKAVYADGLKAGVYGDDGEIFAACNRETAAKLALGALTADMVEYGRGDKLDKVAAGKLDQNGDKELQLFETYKDLKYVANDTDAFGRPGHTWKYGKDFEETYLDEAVKTYTVAVKSGDLYTDLGYTKKNTNKIEVRKNSAKKTSEFAVISGGSDKIGGKGTLLEVYDVTTDDDEYDRFLIVEVETFVSTISGWTKAVTNKNDEIKDKEFVTIADGRKKFETTDFTKEDIGETVVIYNLADGVVKNLKAADSKTLTATKVYNTNDKTTATFTADGTTYEYAANFTVNGNYGLVNKDAVDNETEFDAYFDNYGYVIWMAAPAAATYDTAAYIVLDVEAEKLSAGKYFANVTVLNEKGEEETLKVVKDVNDNNTEAVFFATEAEAKGNVFFGEKSIGKKDALVTLTDKTAKIGYYVWDNTDKNDNTTKTTIKPNETFKFGASAWADGKTVFFVEQYDKKGTMTGYEVYTGIQNVPSLEDANYANEANNVRYVTLNAGKAASEYTAVLVEGFDDATVTTTTRGFTGDVVYVIDETAEYDGSVYTYSAIVNGEKTTVESKIELLLGHVCYVTAYLKDSKTIATVQYNFPTYSYANYLTIANHWNATATKDAVFFNNGVLYSGNTTAVVVADDAVIYDANEEKFVEMSDLEAGTRVLLGYDLNDKAAVKYIIVPVSYTAFDAWCYATNAAADAKRIATNKAANEGTLTVAEGTYFVDVDLKDETLATSTVAVKNGNATVTVTNNTFEVADGQTYTVTITATPKNLVDTEVMKFYVNNKPDLTITGANATVTVKDAAGVVVNKDAAGALTNAVEDALTVGATYTYTVAYADGYKAGTVMVNGVTNTTGSFTAVAGSNTITVNAAAKCECVSLVDKDTSDNTVVIDGLTVTANVTDLNTFTVADLKKAMFVREGITAGACENVTSVVVFDNTTALADTAELKGFVGETDLKIVVTAEKSTVTATYTLVVTEDIVEYSITYNNDCTGVEKAVAGTIVEVKKLSVPIGYTVMFAVSSGSTTTYYYAQNNDTAAKALTVKVVMPAGNTSISAVLTESDPVTSVTVNDLNGAERSTLVEGTVFKGKMTDADGTTFAIPVASKDKYVGWKLADGTGTNQASLTITKVSGWTATYTTDSAKNTITLGTAVGEVFTTNDTPLGNGQYNWMLAIGAKLYTGTFWITNNDTVSFTEPAV